MNPIGVLFTAKGKTKDEIVSEFNEYKKMGIECCQIGISGPETYTDEYAEILRAAIREADFPVSLFWVGLSGPHGWNFMEGPVTIGFVPETWRETRVKEMKAAVLFAEKVGITDLCTHAGFLPENPTDPAYGPVLEVLKDIAGFCKAHGRNFLFETGQETPVTLLRFIEAIGTGNVFINLDTGNLLLYGKGNPADAVRVFGKYVRNTHIKDGFYPENGTELGREVKAGEGLANIPLVYQLLKELGYEGPLSIEREISGEEQKRDIQDTVNYLRGIREA